METEAITKLFLENYYFSYKFSFILPMFQCLVCQHLILLFFCVSTILYCRARMKRNKLDGEEVKKCKDCVKLKNIYVQRMSEMAKK